MSIVFIKYINYSTFVFFFPPKYLKMFSKRFEYDFIFYFKQFTIDLLIFNII